MLSNKGLSVDELTKPWVRYVLKEQQNVIVALDWSAFADDHQSMLSLNWVSEKGLSTPLVWKSVDNKRLKYNRPLSKLNDITQNYKSLKLN
jgi:hypothetical protein